MRNLNTLRVESLICASGVCSVVGTPLCTAVLSLGDVVVDVVVVDFSSLVSINSCLTCGNSLFDGDNFIEFNVEIAVLKTDIRVLTSFLTANFSF